MRKIAFLVILFIAAVCIFGSMMIVDTTGAEGDTLQYYIDLAASMPMFNPDTIILMPGTYNVHSFNDSGFMMRDSVILIGAIPMACTLSAVSENGADTSENVISFMGLGSSCYSGIKFLTITGVMSSGSGSGVTVYNSSPFIDSCFITKNHCGDYGAGIAVWGNSTPDITNNTILGNYAYQGGGGIYIDTLANAFIYGNTIISDTSSQGGGILVHSGTGTIRNNQVMLNVAAWGGGIAVIGGPGSIIDSCDIKYNQTNDVNGYGGGIFVNESPCSIYNSNIIGNISDYYGGGIFLNYDFNDPSHVQYNIIDSNISGGGGGICLFGAANSRVENNFIRYNLAGDGGGIGISTQSNPVLYDNVVKYNSASNGGGIGINDNCSPNFDGNDISNNTASGAGGGIAIYDSCYPVINGNWIDYNTANQYGGGIFMDSYCSPVIQHNEINWNASNQYGGAVYMQFYSDPNILNNRIIGNSASIYGGALFIYDYSEPTVSSNDISENVSGNAAAGAFLYSNAYAAFTSNIFYKNSATNGAGGIGVADNATAIVTECVFAGNTARGGATFVDTLNSVIIVDSCFIADNGSTANRMTGLGYMCPNASPGMFLSRSNVYYNTFQQDTEFVSTMTDTLYFEGNFWWLTDSTDIADLLYGPVLAVSSSASYVTTAPWEPESVDSVRVYSDSLYTASADSLDAPGNIYISVRGTDHTADVQEVSICIVKSSIYPDGIAVALKEIIKNSGIYRGMLTVEEQTDSDDIRLDDINNVIRVDSLGDIITITANSDTTESWTIYYKYDPSGIVKNIITESRTILEIPAIKTGDSKMAFTMKNTGTAKIEVIDMTGRIISEPVNGTYEAGRHTFDFNAPSGVYFIRFTCPEITESRRITIIK